MNEPLLARKIKDALDAGLKVSAEASARLVAARERALERHRAPTPEMAFAGGGRTATRLAGPAQRLTRLLLPIAFLGVALVGLHQWQEHQRATRIAAQQAAEIEETDARLLTGDLPIKAYLDEDFQAWLKRSSE
ncbi:MAG TPA: DUF3619 family protein [Burkholderiales bacterium]|nr:DUF3619 family protein [Burkholderiales bacterium]